MTIIEGSIDDLIENIDFICGRIAKKLDLTENMIKERLRDRKYGVKLLKSSLSLQGIFVWYEDDASDAYLWLGAVERQGTGHVLMDAIMSETNYDRWYVKTDKNNMHAIRFLERYNFKKYVEEEDIVYLEKRG